ncbi:hypothetical protein A33K_18334 [Burkholderia humptydooensis MSMB43]|uniref:Uncharacterized protein n=1 Tax=Burkholderia humptydooensis MSMB43 TaxID=441157 RepID=A0ABN0FYN9_9BURK|nr:hypothetical protein A33K_18334 [Burkholderia humptydooensis MSMB43]
MDTDHLEQLQVAGAIFADSHLGANVRCQMIRVAQSEARKRLLNRAIAKLSPQRDPICSEADRLPPSRSQHEVFDTLDPAAVGQTRGLQRHHESSHLPVARAVGPADR